MKQREQIGSYLGFIQRVTSCIEHNLRSEYFCCSQHIAAVRYPALDKRLLFANSCLSPYLPQAGRF
jgi:hypothetical protein